MKAFLWFFSILFLLPAVVVIGGVVGLWVWVMVSEAWKSVRGVGLLRSVWLGFKSVGILAGVIVLMLMVMILMGLSLEWILDQWAGLHA